MTISRYALPVLCAALVFDVGSRAQGEIRRPSRENVRSKSWNRFHDYPELVDLMHAIQNEWPERSKLLPIGKSHQGRTIWLMTVTDPKTGPAMAKPAMYVDGNIHGNEVQGSEAALYTAWYLLKHARRLPKLEALLGRTTFYIVPTVNPDGRAFWFQKANTMSSSRGGQVPTDNDGDGFYDEDGASDLDGDGNICRMRKKVPGKGDYRLDPSDPRIMIRCKPGEKGDYIRLGYEGVDEDGDGRVNEDGPGGYDPNRDWGSDWQPGWIQRGARAHPFSLPETRAVRDFLLAHPNIAGVQAFHNSGGMILRGPGDKNVSYQKADVRVYDAMGKRGQRMLPFYRYLILWKDLYTVHGSFVDWTYLGLGILSFSNELWTTKRMLASGSPLDQRTRIQWDDEQAFGSHYVAWHPYEHPTYGEVEIGGWAKDTGRIPPGFMIEEMLHRNAAFVLYQAGELPELELEEARVDDAGNGLKYVTITIRNKRLTPTRTAQAAAKKIGKPDLLRADSRTVQILIAGEPRARFRPELSRLLDEKIRPERIPLEQGVPSGGKLEMCYLVEGKGKIRFRYQAEKAKDLEFSVEIR